MKYDFLLKDQDNKPVILSKITSRYTIIFFYPKDNTPGCSIEAQNFSHLKDQFALVGATILGISGGTL
jgi:peroxiredoxin Q/BCP